MTYGFRAARAVFTTSSIGSEETGLAEDAGEDSGDLVRGHAGGQGVAQVAVEAGPGGDPARVRLAIGLDLPLAGHARILGQAVVAEVRLDRAHHGVG